MRELKFRQAVSFDGKFHHWHYWGLIEGEFRGITSLVAPNFQFTGLKDKNGKEICEGDIRSKVDELNNRINKRKIRFGVIKFGEYSCSCDEYSSSQYGFYLDGYDEYERTDGEIDRYPNEFSLMDCLDMVSIGNIYENPELLKDGTHAESQ